MVCEESERLIESQVGTFPIFIYIFNKTSVIVLYIRIFLIKTWLLNHHIR